MTDELAELERLAGEARDAHAAKEAVGVAITAPDKGCPHPSHPRFREWSDLSDVSDAADAWLVESARAAVPALVAEVRRLRAEVERLGGVPGPPPVAGVVCVGGAS